MSNNPNDPDDPQSEDSFDSERLPDVKQIKALKNAQKRKAESFTSFSEGTQAIDKFKILGATGEHPVVRTPAVTAIGEQNKVEPVPQPDSGIKVDPHIGSSAASEHSTKTASERGYERDSVPPRGIMRQARKDDSFTSFSEGLPTVDKFGIVDPDANKVLPLYEFLSESSCSFLAPYGETTGATSDSFQKFPDLSNANSLTEKSRTLSRLMFLFEAAPWSDSLNVELCKKPQFIEYSFDEHIMMLDKSSNDEHTILNFAHQAYHSTNRLLTKLYDDEKLDRESFIDLYIWSEVAALVTELNVRKELGIIKVTPPKVLCQESTGSIYSVNVEELLKSRGMKTLHDVLFHSMVRGTEDLSLVYVFDKLFDIYDQTYERELPIARQYIDLCLSSGIDRDCI